MDYKNIAQQIVDIHEHLRLEWPHLNHVAIALYDPEKEELHSFANSENTHTKLIQFVQKISSFPELQKIAETKIPHMIDASSLFANPDHQSSSSNFDSSFTLPIFLQNGDLLGFIFFSADKNNFFTKTIQDHLIVYTRLIRSMILSDILPLKILQAAVIMTQNMTRYKDEETAGHIARVAYYSRMIAESLAQKHNLSDEFINYILLYAPLHDIGKLAIPDSILLKPGRLDPDEYEIMKTHVIKGEEIVKMLISSFDLADYDHTSMLINITSYHHERINGEGYPHKLKSLEIPIESRIIAVADVFDAMSNPRPYHKGRSIEETFEHLHSNAGILFDPDCVNALLQHKQEIFEIRKIFVAEEYNFDLIKNSVI
ncbi:MAG: HD-GYP domain-containing protein [Thiovulaceae bacterium]|nr:HD-GYP domain-containing protein [Sulfurimonadaceae bacterium]